MSALLQGFAIVLTAKYFSSGFCWCMGNFCNAVVLFCENYALLECYFNPPISHCNGIVALTNDNDVIVFDERSLKNIFKHAFIIRIAVV